VRGSHINSRHKTKEDQKQEIGDHINSFPTVENHYARNRTQDEHLHPDMYNMYNTTYPETTVKKYL
jgi:hypothetical protein